MNKSHVQGAVGGLILGILASLGLHNPTPTPAPAPGATATAVPACSTPAISAYEIWKLAVQNKACVAGKRLPSGRPFGDPYRCRQNNVEYPMAQNPFWSGDQPHGCGLANKDPYSMATIKWDGSNFVNVSAGGSGGSTRSCYPTGVGASGEMYVGPCVVTTTCKDLGDNFFAGTGCKAPTS